jgi:hypothetical protein
VSRWSACNDCCKSLDDPRLPAISKAADRMFGVEEPKEN